MKTGVLIYILLLSIMIKEPFPIIYDPDIKMNVDGNYLYINPQPFMEEGVTMAPIRPLLENLGATVYWIVETKSIVYKKDSITVTLQLGSTEAIINNEKVNLDTPLNIKNGTIYASVRFIVESLGGKIDYNKENTTLSIKTKDFINSF